MATFTPYQVDYSVKNASKTFGFSKKRVSFKFGVANEEALRNGLTGSNCRGSEHEIIFIWSLNSGKRQILADGKDVHFSESGINGWTSDQVFQHHFNLRVPNLNSPLRCHLVTQPTNKEIPSIKPFDLRVNGISFFGFSKIFQLGTTSMVSRSLRGSGGRNSDDDPYITPEERKAIAAAKLASIRDMREGSQGGYGGYNGGGEGNLIDFDAPAPAPAPPPAAPPAAPYAQQAYSNYSLGPTPPAAAPPAAPGYGAPPAAPPAYGAPPPQQQQFAGYGAPPPSQPPPYYQQPQPSPSQSQPAFGTGVASPTAQTVASYGSAPTFAMPPQQQQQQQQYPPPPQQQQQNWGY